ncbi:hypothetical protein PCA20602_02203 [Pandoraea capi]|uniref:Uncharacterized protein n=1 Tax=Pandoraea capi TaxID=2508286 RepID=A0ABY6VXX8_9BURK|nr:hypothetical protein [Pandoraea capi]VVE02407.1 hypothetical protein PCA20602_02203 [Pandoraea capi]
MSSLLPIALEGHFTRSLSNATIQRCATAASKKDLKNVWSEVKDFVLGTHKCAAEAALYDLSHAKTTREQFDAFNALTYYIEPGDRHKLAWKLDVSEFQGFQIGEHRFPVPDDIGDFMKGTVPMTTSASCRLLNTLHLNDHHVLLSSQQFGLDLSPLSNIPTDNDLYGATMRHVLIKDFQTRFSHFPALLDTLQVLGLDQDDASGQFALEVMQETEHQLAQTGLGSVAATMAENAAHLVRLASAMKDDR